MSYEVIEIIEEWLKDEGYEGLYALDCGCEIGNIAPCGNINLTNCKAGVKVHIKGKWEIHPRSEEIG